LKVDHRFKTVVKGFAATLTPRQLSVVRANPKVALVEENQVYTALQCEAQSVPTAQYWGLIRVSQRDLDLSVPRSYYYPSSSGAGVNAYIIDTGIYVAHQEFGGRARFGFKSEQGWSNTDGNGHGTHVASTVGGEQYGVAKAVALIGVKVLSDAGSGSTAGVIAGVEWAAEDHLNQDRPSVGNMSLGGGFSAIMNAACNEASVAGLLMVVAAGNENNNACTRSPASAEFVVSTGATSNIDARAFFSNWGTCVDIFAPGLDILGAWIGGTTQSRVISGTSMASPHACGVSALYVEENPTANFQQLHAYLQSSSTKDKINMNCAGACGASVNFLAWNGCLAPQQ